MPSFPSIFARTCLKSTTFPSCNSPGLRYRVFMDILQGVAELYLSDIKTPYARSRSLPCDFQQIVKQSHSLMFCRAYEEELVIMASVDTYTPKMLSSLNYGVEQPPYTPEIPPSLNYEVEQPPYHPEMPPSDHEVKQPSYYPEMPPSLSHEVEQPSCNQETNVNHVCEGLYPTLHPSFTSLIANCCFEVKEAAAKPTAPEEVDLKSLIVRYMEDSSFQDMMVKVEKVIDELGGDLSL